MLGWKMHNTGNSEDAMKKSFIPAILGISLIAACAGTGELVPPASTEPVPAIQAVSANAEPSRVDTCIADVARYLNESRSVCAEAFLGTQEAKDASRPDLEAICVEAALENFDKRVASCDANAV
jgi:hypothetical protein